MMKEKYDNAISNILGSILIVVIVTILASITALFVFVYLEDTGTAYLVELTLDRLDSSTVEISNRGGPNLVDLDSSNPTPFIVYIDDIVAVPIPPTQLTKDVGSFGHYHVNPGQSVSIIGLFNGDKKQLIFKGTA